MVIIASFSNRICKFLLITPTYYILK